MDFFHLALLPRPALVVVIRLLDVIGEVEEDDVREPTKHQLLHLVRNLQQLFVHPVFFIIFATTPKPSQPVLLHKKAAIF